MSGDPGGAADRYFMEQALALAAIPEGRTSPNPRVGCVVARDGAVVGFGYHRAAGQPHAEAVALLAAAERARGATLYVNLEPCAHHGRTPPCADLLLQSGVSRVVAAVTDPNPLVNGQGFERLRRGGVRVEVGLLEDAARRLNAPFLRCHLRARPSVTLKAAISLDGRIAGLAGESRWITGEAARRFAHRLRLRHDAVLVGSGTARRDDPRLTARLAGVETARVRAVIAPHLDLDPAGRLFDGAVGPRPRLYVARDVPAARVRAFEGRADLVAVGGSGRTLELREILDDLRGIGVLSVLVEGGGRTLASFLRAGLADEMALFIAPRLIGSVGATAVLDGTAVGRPDEAPRLEDLRRIPLGADLLVLGRVGGAVCSPD